MKKILLIVSLVMGIFVSIQAADEIFIQVNNTSWACKTRLECCVDYNNIKKNFSLILEGTTDTDPITKTLYTLPKGAIQSIKLDLTNYHEVPEFDDMAETLLADLVFKPTTSALLGITFTIKGNKIKHEAVYG